MRRSPIRYVDPVEAADNPGLDVTWLLTGWLVLLYAIHARLVIPGLGSLGHASILVALMGGLWWLAGRLVPDLGLDRGLQPIRAALYLHSGYLIASYGVGATRTLTELERSSSSRQQILLVAFTSIALLAADGISDLPRLRTLLRRLTTIGALFAGYGIVQVLMGEALLLVPPGLEWNEAIEADVLERGGFLRPIAAAMHPIEYAVIVSSLLPLAIHFVLHPRSRGDRVRAIVELSLLIMAMPFSLSRTAIVCAAVVLIVLGLGWSWRRRAIALAIGLAIVPLVAALVPAIFQFMVDLFTGADTDPSVQDRIDRIPAIMAVIRERPWFGWGYGTYSVEDFFLIDNQLWVTIISTGIVGLIVTLALPAVAVMAALWHRPHDDPSGEWSHLGRAIAACIAGFTASTVTFTAFSYRTLTFTLFLLIGCAGAFWRLTRPLADDGRSSEPDHLRVPEPRVSLPGRDRSS